MQHHASPETPAIVGYDGQLILSACLLSHRPITTSHICGSLSYTDTCHNTHCTHCTLLLAKLCHHHHHRSLCPFGPSLKCLSSELESNVSLQFHSGVNRVRQSNAACQIQGAFQSGTISIKCRPFVTINGFNQGQEGSWWKFNEGKDPKSDLSPSSIQNSNETGIKFVLKKKNVRPNFYVIYCGIFCQNSSPALTELTESVPRLLIFEKAPNEQRTVSSFCSFFLFFPRQNVRRVDWIWQNEFPSAPALGRRLP